MKPIKDNRQTGETKIVQGNNEGDCILKLIMVWFCFVVIYFEVIIEDNNLSGVDEVIKKNKD